MYALVMQGEKNGIKRVIPRGGTLQTKQLNQTKDTEAEKTRMNKASTRARPVNRTKQSPNKTVQTSKEAGKGKLIYRH